MYATVAQSQAVRSAQQAAEIANTYLPKFGFSEPVDMAWLEVNDGPNGSVEAYKFLMDDVWIYIRAYNGLPCLFSDSKAAWETSKRQGYKGQYVVQDEAGAWRIAEEAMKKLDVPDLGWARDEIKAYGLDQKNDGDQNVRGAVHMRFAQKVEGVLGDVNSWIVELDAVTGKVLMAGGTTQRHYSAPRSVLSVDEAVARAKAIVEREHATTGDDANWIWIGDEEAKRSAFLQLNGPNGVDENRNIVPRFGSTYAGELNRIDPYVVRQTWVIAATKSFGQFNTSAQLWLDAENGEPMRDALRSAGIRANVATPVQTKPQYSGGPAGATQRAMPPKPKQQTGALAVAVLAAAAGAAVYAKLRRR